MAKVTKEKMNVVDQVINDKYAIYCGDSCEVIRDIPSNSIGFGIHSPPFEGLYRFSAYDRDISNNDNKASFFQHYQFLIEELYRVTIPGRIHAVHVMQLPTSKVRDGVIGMRDFRGEVVRAYAGDDAMAINEAIVALEGRSYRMDMAGADVTAITDLIYRLRSERDERAYAKGRWIFHSEVCIWKDPVVAQQRTKSIRLLHKQIVKDSALSGQGLADFMCMFRKPGDNPDPIAGCFRQWIGEGDGPNFDKYTTDMDGRNWFSIEVWQRFASPVWSDIRQTRTLQFRGGRDEKDEVHISPLQLDVIERCLALWSNPGDTVLTPFLGIGSEVFCAVEMGRKGIGIELKPSYFAQAVKNLEGAGTKAPGLFAEPEPIAAE